MSLSTYADLQTQVTNWLHRSDLATYIPDFITLFEAEAARRLRVRPQEATTVLTVSSSTALTVTGAANNGSGLIRLTVPTATLTTGTEVDVAGVGGTVEASATWLITVIDSTHIDLQGSIFTNAYTSGGTVTTTSGKAALPSDYIGWKRITWTGSPRVDLDYYHPSIEQAWYPKTGSDTPQSFTIEGGNIVLRKNNVGTLELVYFQKTAALSGALNWLYTNHPDAYLNGTLYESYKFTKDPDNMQIYKGLRDEIFNEIALQNFRQYGNLSIRPLNVIV